MKSLRSFFPVVLAASVVWFRPGMSLAQADAPASNAVKSVEELDQKVRIVERRLDLAEENAQTRSKETPQVAAGKDGFALSSADGAFKLRLRGYIQTDARFFIDDNDKPAADTFLVRRARPILEGTIYQQYDFRFMPDFGNGQTVLQDAYVDDRFMPEVNLRAGKFKPPLGLERLQSATDLLFPEYALPTSLVPNRDIGVELYGGTSNGVVGYALGVFNGVTDGSQADTDTDDGKDAVARVWVAPFKNSGLAGLAGLGFGIAGSYGKTDGTLSAPGLPSFKTSGQQTFFSYLSSTNLNGTVVADGAHQRVVPQAYYYWGPLGLLGEYVQSSQKISKGQDTATVGNDAWQIAGSYVLTGEAASYKGVTPTRPFDWAKGNWGALEVAARYTALNVDSAVWPDFADAAKSAKDARAWAAGVNWYLNRNVKFMLDYEQTQFTGGAKGGDREDEKLVLSRLQLAF